MVIKSILNSRGKGCRSNHALTFADFIATLKSGNRVWKHTVRVILIHKLHGEVLLYGNIYCGRDKHLPVTSQQVKCKDHHVVCTYYSDKEGGFLLCEILCSLLIVGCMNDWCHCFESAYFLICTMPANRNDLNKGNKDTGSTWIVVNP